MKNINIKQIEQTLQSHPELVAQIAAVAERDQAAARKQQSELKIAKLQQYADAIERALGECRRRENQLKGERLALCKKLVCVNADIRDELARNAPKGVDPAMNLLRAILGDDVKPRA